MMLTRRSSDMPAHPDTPRGHPMRRRLPAPRAVPRREDDDDLKLFALSFTAFFVCFYTFLM